jgi:cell division protease FtsH
VIDKCYQDAEEILKKNMNILHATAALLIEKERITREEFEVLFTQDEQKA